MEFAGWALSLGIVLVALIYGLVALVLGLTAIRKVPPEQVPDVLGSLAILFRAFRPGLKVFLPSRRGRDDPPP